MQTQEFLGSSKLSEGRDAKETPAGSKAPRAPLGQGILNVLDQQEPGPQPQPQASETHYEQSEPEEVCEPSGGYESYIVYKSQKPCEPSAPSELHVFHGFYEPYESYYENCDSPDHYESYEPEETCHPPEPLKHRKRSKPQGSLKSQERHALDESPKLRVPRKSQASQASHDAYKAHKAELPPSAAATTALPPVTRNPPRTSSPSDHTAYEFPKKSSFSRKRIEELSKPKKEWGTPDRNLSWGNQDPIRPICPSALKIQPTKRLESLAQPKEVSHRYVPNRSQYYYSCGGGSAIWNIPSSALTRKPSKRIQRLSQPNRFRTMQTINRSLSDSLTRGSLPLPGPSPRILRLSIAKGLSPDYLPPKDMGTKIVSAALRAIATPRIVDLASPKIKIEGLCYPRERADVPIRPVTHAALLNIPSPRTSFLAKAKSLPQDYLPARDPYWPVSYAAAHCKTSPRIEELANPNARIPMRLVYYDPEVFKVKPAALTAQCSQRVQELAEPLTR